MKSVHLSADSKINTEKSNACNGQHRFLEGSL